MKNIVIHHTSVSVEKQGTQLLAVNRYHKNKWEMKSKLGWYVGYNYFIDVNGRMTPTRQEGEETMAQKGHNFDSISICLAGDFVVEYPSNVQIDALVDLMKEIRGRYPSIKIVGHRALQANRTCPGKLMSKKYIDELVEKRVKSVYNPDNECVKREEIEKLHGRLDAIMAFLEYIISIIIK